jgi:hypothetical protein
MARDGRDQMNGLGREPRITSPPLVPSGGPRLGSRTFPEGPVWDLWTALHPDLEALIDTRSESVGGAALDVLRRGAGRVIIGVRHRAPLESTVVENGRRFLEAVRDAAPERQGQAILLEACAWRVGRPERGPWQVLAEVIILCWSLEQLAETDPELVAPAIERLGERLLAGTGTVRLPASVAADVALAHEAMVVARARLGRPIRPMPALRRPTRALALDY